MMEGHLHQSRLARGKVSGLGFRDAQAAFFPNSWDVWVAKVRDP